MQKLKVIKGWPISHYIIEENAVFEVEIIETLEDQSVKNFGWGYPFYSIYLIFS